MGPTIASWARTAALLAVLVIAFPPGMAQCQAPPSAPSSPAQVDTPPGPAAEPTSPETQAPGAPSAQTQDPFAGSPLLQMFERIPDASAPIRQLRFAPSIGEPIPLSVQLFLTAEEEYTDNADQTKNNRRSEFRTRVVPGLAVRVDRPLANLSLSYAPEVVIPNNSIGETELNQNLSARFSLWPSGKLRFTVAEDFTDSSDFSDVQDPGTRRTGTGDFIRNQVTAEAAYVLPKLRTAFAYTNIINQEDVGFTDTRIAHIVRPTAAYTDPRFSLSGAFDLTRGDENSSVAVPYWRYGGEARYLHVLTPTVSAGLTGTYVFQEPDVGQNFTIGRLRALATVQIGRDGTAEAEVGADAFRLREEDSVEFRPSGALSYTHRFFALAITARYEQGYELGYEDVDSTGTTFTRSAGVFLSSALFRNLTTTLGFRYEENTFQFSTIQGVAAGTRDRTYSIDAGIRYLLVRSLYLSLGYTGTFRISSQDTAEFNENRVRLGLTYQYGLF